MIERSWLLQNKVPKIAVEHALSDRMAGLIPTWNGARLDTAIFIRRFSDLECLSAFSGRALYLFVSNSDNLGATMDPSLLKWFADSDMPFLMEVTTRTGADRKGGHLAKRSSDGQLLLRESAQCSDEDMGAFQDIDRHRYFNTNNLWLRLDRLAEALERNGGLLPLPVIRNQKTVDPRDKKSPKVYQLETAMGAAIECFAGAGGIVVPRTRFAPVKTTSDLLALRSDAYIITDDGRAMLAPERKGIPPEIDLDSDHFKLVSEKLGWPSRRSSLAVALRKLTCADPCAFAAIASRATSSSKPKGPILEGAAEADWYDGGELKLGPRSDVYLVGSDTRTPSGGWKRKSSGEIFTFRSSEKVMTV